MNMMNRVKILKELTIIACSKYIMLLFFIFFLSCSMHQNNQESEDSFDPDIPEDDYHLESQEIENLGVEFSPYEKLSSEKENNAGAFIFNSYLDRPIIPFGENTIDGIKDNPTFEYHLSNEAKVYAIADGTVSALEFRSENNDYSITTQQEGKDLTIIYDHITQPQVEEGESIVAESTPAESTFLGYPEQNFSGTEEYVYGRVEIQVCTGDDDNPEDSPHALRAHCPLSKMNEENRVANAEKIRKLIIDWEDYTGDSDQYDESSWHPSNNYPGCVNISIIP